MRFAFMALLIAMGCGDDSSPPADARPPDTTERPDGGLPLDTVASGTVGSFPTEPRDGTCDFRGGSGSPTIDGCTEESTMYFFVSRVTFPELVIREDERNRAAGFDLDGVDSDGSAEGAGCRQRDVVSLDGRFGGVDNQGAALVPTLDSVLTTDLATTAATAIGEGRFGVLVELRHWNVTANDDCVDVIVHQASPVAPLDLDPDGAPRPGQSFVAEGMPRHFVNERMEDGELRADSGGFPVPQPFMSDLQSAHLRLQWDGAQMSGVVAGDLPASLAVATLFCREPRIPESVLDDILTSVADLRPDSEGGCEGISWAFEIETVSALLADI